MLSLLLVASVVLLIIQLAARGGGKKVKLGSYRTCTNCNGLSDIHASACAHCGTPIPPLPADHPAVLARAATQQQCPACRAWIDRDATRCRHCTAQIATSMPAEGG